MTEDNYTSLELSEKLKECGIDSKYWWVHRPSALPFLYKRMVKHQFLEIAPAYDILNDICVKYAKEFFGRDRIETDTDLVFKLMKIGKKQEAEDYIWEHCLFNKKS